MTRTFGYLLSTIRDGMPAAICAAVMTVGSAAAQLPPVPEPAENPVTEAGRILGKMLFWDEQLSFDDTVACGTCHRPASGGADPRRGRHPGTDPGTLDDVLGSPGIARQSRSGDRIEHAVFGTEVQVTPRTSPSNFAAIWARELFWDGRAGGMVTDPLTGELLIREGGALEAQALAALSNPAEMASEDHDWSALVDKVATIRPLALASMLPMDISAALQKHANYPDLFAAAYGEPEISPGKIAFAIASYQRTLVADQTPWDLMQRGEATLSDSARRGWRDFQAFRCSSCHEPPLFTNNDFSNIGLRLSRFDQGRGAITGDPEDAGEVKIPSLRNVALRPRYMHTGQFANLGAAVGFYINSPALEDRDTMPGGGVYSFNMSTQAELDIRSFLEEALTDPRVREQTPPFDRPTLRSERPSP